MKFLKSQKTDTEIEISNLPPPPPDTYNISHSIVLVSLNFSQLCFLYLQSSNLIIFYKLDLFIINIIFEKLTHFDTFSLSKLFVQCILLCYKDETLFSQSNQLDVSEVRIHDPWDLSLQRHITCHLTGGYLYNVLYIM